MINLPTGCILADIQHLVPYAKNPKNHNDKDIDLIIKQIKGFDDYFVSNKGNVYSKKSGEIREIKPHFDTKGYLVLKLHKEHRSYCKKVHRLVAEAFIPNPKNKPQVNHIDGDKTNNYVKNLEWNTNAENNLHAYRVLGHIRLRGKLHSSSKPVLQMIGDIIVAEFDGCNEAGRNTGIRIAGISQCCNGKQKTAGGYKWKYK